MGITFVLRHINRLPRGQMFTTRDCLVYGTRASVDQALSRLVRSGYLRRLARGVFIRDHGEAELPSPIEIARVKAKAFGKVILEHGADLAARLGLAPSGNSEPTFLVDGHSSSFHAADRRINLKGGCPGKFNAAESPAGDIVRALWHLGRAACTVEVLGTVMRICGRQEREVLHAAAAWTPAWLSAHFIVPGRFPTPPLTREPALEAA